MDLAIAAARGPTISSRLYALVNTALYDTWSLFDPEAVPSLATGLEQRSLERLLRQPGGGSFRAIAMASAAQQVFSSLAASMLVGPKTALLTSFVERSRVLVEQSLQAAAAAGGSGLSPQLTVAATQLGSNVASAIQAWALNDGANQQNNYQDTAGYAPQPSVFDSTAAVPRYDDSWQPLKNSAGVSQTALTPQWGRVTPFAIGSGSALRPAGILPVYSSDDRLNPTFVAEANQVLEISAALTPEQKASAEVWESGSGTAFPPGTWLEITDELIRSNRLDLDAAVKLSFGVTQALFDAGIAAWATKFSADTVRPITFLRQYYANRSSSDGGDPITDWRGVAISGDQWQPYQSPGSLTPNFPDVPSGHSSFSTAAAAVLRSQLGSNLLGKTTTLADTASRIDPRGFDGVAGVEGPAISLHWPTLSGAAELAGLSRLYGGIHFNEGNWQGQVMGARVGALVNARLASLFHAGRSSAKTVTQAFGTMAGEQLASTAQEVYGFGGMDTLIAGGTFRGSSGRGHRRTAQPATPQQLFGGTESDTFVLTGRTAVLIRDISASETIAIAGELRSTIAGQPPTFSLGPSSRYGASFSDLSLNGRVIAHLDGRWSLDQLNLGVWTS